MDEVGFYETLVCLYQSTMRHLVVVKNNRNEIACYNFFLVWQDLALD
jgi:hypothetical protein